MDHRPVIAPPGHHASGPPSPAAQAKPKRRPGARRQGRPDARVNRGNPATVRLHVAFGAGDGDCYVLGAGVDLELEPLAVRDHVAGGGRHGGAASLPEDLPIPCGPPVE